MRRQILQQSFKPLKPFSCFFNICDDWTTFSGPSFTGVPVLLWHARPHVSVHVMGSARGRGRREEAEMLLPCPLIVFSVLSGSSPALWEYPCVPGSRAGGGGVPLHPESDSNRSPSLPWFQLLFPSSCCYSSFPLSVFLRHTNIHSNMAGTPSSFPPPGTSSSVYSPKLHFPNKVKLQLQRLRAQRFHTQYGSPASSHVVLGYCFQGTHVLGMLLAMFWRWCAWSPNVSSADLFLHVTLGNSENYGKMDFCAGLEFLKRQFPLSKASLQFKVASATWLQPERDAQVWLICHPLEPPHYKQTVRIKDLPSVWPWKPSIPLKLSEMYIHKVFHGGSHISRPLIKKFKMLPPQAQI